MINVIVKHFLMVKFQPSGVYLQVYDYDVSSGDDYLGEAVLPLPQPGEVI